MSIGYGLTADIEGSAKKNIYDGIWKISEQGYASIYQQEDTITILILGNSPTLGYKWEAQVGV